MNFYPKGWNTYKFIVTPIEFEDLIDEFYIVKKDKNVIINEYKIFYEKLISNYKFEWKNDFKYFNFLPIGLTNNLEKNKENNAIEPSVGINFFVLHFFGKEKKLHSNFSYTQFPEKVMGLELTYPKELYYYEKKGNDVKIIKKIECNEIENYNEVYKKLIGKINKVSKNLIIIEEKEIRTNIKLSINAKEKIRNTYFLRSNNLRIK